MSPDTPSPTRPGASGPGRAAGLALALAVGLVGIAFWTFWSQQARENRGRVLASAQRFTWGPADGEPLTAVTRGEKGEVVLHVTLEDAPLGEELPLACTWTAGDGSVQHRNRWKTRKIDHTPWVTHCKHQIGAGEPAGLWTVSMTLDGRELAAARLEVR